MRQMLTEFWWERKAPASQASAELALYQLKKNLGPLDTQNRTHGPYFLHPFFKALCIQT
jgi:hypothetical protein